MQMTCHLLGSKALSGSQCNSALLEPVGYRDGHSGIIRSKDLSQWKSKRTPILFYCMSISLSLSFVQHFFYSWVRNLCSCCSELDEHGQLILPL